MRHSEDGNQNSDQEAFLYMRNAPSPNLLKDHTDLQEDLPDASDPYIEQQHHLPKEADTEYLVEKHTFYLLLETTLKYRFPSIEQRKLNQS